MKIIGLTGLTGAGKSTVAKALAKVLDEYHPDRILIEPSGVGKLSDVIKAVKNTGFALNVPSANLTNNPQLQLCD